MDAIASLFPFRKVLLKKLEDFVKEKMSSPIENIEDFFDQKLKEDIYILNKNQQLGLYIDNLKTMLLLEAGKHYPNETRAILNEGGEILYTRCPKLPELADDCGDIALDTGKQDSNEPVNCGSTPNQGGQILYERRPTLSQHANICRDIAKTLNDRVLDTKSDNLNALCNRVILLTSSDNGADGNTDEEAEQQSDEMVTMLKMLEINARDNDFNMLVAKAEVAGMFTYLEINLESLKNSICLYEEVLAQVGKFSRGTTSNSLLDSLVVFWKQDLLWNYKLLTYGQEHDEALSRAKDLVKELQQSPIVDHKRKAKAWANLALIYEHHILTYQDRWPGQKKTTEKQQIRECFAKAMRLDPTNARIHMLAARELRKRIQTETGQLQAIEWLQISLDGEDTDDIRGFTLFNMGLAYRSLWISNDRPFHDVRVNADLLPPESDKHSDHRRYKARVINAPIQPVNFCDLPPPYKTPKNNSVGWRFLNQIARDRNNPYLLEARRCLHEASETKEERCMFLVELARTYISTRDIAEARKCLQRAQRETYSDMAGVGFLGVSLHENMAFLEESEMMTRNTFNDAEAEKIKSLYRESIRQSTRSDWQPVVAFHCLLALLYKQLESIADKHLAEIDQMMMQNEYFLLYMAIQEAKESRRIVKAFAIDDFRIALMWRLIEMFHHRNQQYDAEAAFTYLSILVMANKLTAEVKGIGLTVVEKKRMLIQSAERVAQQRVALAEVRYLLPQYKELFDLCGTRLESGSACSSAGESLSDDEEKKLNIVMKIVEPEFQTSFLCRKERV